MAGNTEDRTAETAAGAETGGEGGAEAGAHEGRRRFRSKRRPRSEREPKPQRGRPSVGTAVALVRTRVGQLLWLVAVVAALFLAVGALLVALDANEGNSLVDFVVSGADLADLDVFSREAGQGIFDFTGENADVKRTLVNWGLGAVAWLVAGKIAERLVRP